MVGPYDLAGSLGIPGKINHEKVRNAVKQVFETCEQYGKSCGPHEVEPTYEIIQDSFNSGSTFVVLSSDIFILWKWGERMKEIIKLCQ